MSRHRTRVLIQVFGETKAPNEVIGAGKQAVCILSVEQAYQTSTANLYRFSVDTVLKLHI